MRTNNTPSGAKKHRENTKSESRQMFSYFFLLLLLLLLQMGQFKFAWLLHDGFHTKQQHFPLNSAPANRFFTGLESHEVVRTAHWRTMASFATPFFFIFLHVYACAQITEMWLLCKIAELEILLVCGECLKEAWSGKWFFSQYYIGSLWGKTCCSVIDGQLQFKHASAAKWKWQEQE